MATLPALSTPATSATDLAASGTSLEALGDRFEPIALDAAVFVKVRNGSQSLVHIALGPISVSFVGATEFVLKKVDCGLPTDHHVRQFEVLRQVPLGQSTTAGFDLCQIIFV